MTTAPDILTLTPPATAPNRRVTRATEVSTPIGPMDLWITAVTLALLTIGVVTVYSATIGPADNALGDPSFYLRHHLLNIAIGTLALVAGALIPFRLWRKLAYPLLLTSIILLVVLLFVGKTYGKSTRWIPLGVMNIQPSEIAKFAFIVYLARSIAEKTEKMRRFSLGILPHLLILIVIMVLSLAQPDLGTCIILATLMVMMLFVAGTRISFIVLLFFASVPVVAHQISSSSARWARILAFLDPWSHRYDVGFQTANALIALGSGGATGMGLGAGHQSMGGFLPEAESDFILPVIGEELGFIGVVVVLVLFAILIIRGATIAGRLRDDFGRFLAFGLTMLIGLQAAINAAVSVDMLPTKGLTLPLISLGGSSMLVTMGALGVLLNLSREAGAAPPDEDEVTAAERSSVGGG